jgi:type VII secretion protein EccB
MPSNPTTKSQVQAYQFVLRRMQSALVRKDAVMLHDPMRTHSRATIVGVVISAVAMLGVVIFGLLKPAPTAPGAGNIVIGEQSGAVYVVAGEPKRLIPTFNLASARLILMAQSQQGQQGQQGGAQPAAVEAKVPEVVPDDQLKDLPRERLMGIPDGPQLLPTSEQRITPEWAICDNMIIDRSLQEQVALQQAKNETIVFAGETDLGRELGPNEALLVTSDDEKTYLIYRQSGNANQPNANTVKAEVDTSDSAVQAALRLQMEPRKVSMGLLNAIPPVNPLRTPDITGAGGPSDVNVANLDVGAVFSTPRAGAPEPDYWVLTQKGIQQVSSAVADMILTRYSATGAQIQQLGRDQIQNAPVLQPGDEGHLDVGHFPQNVPTVLDPLQFPVSCLGWSVRGEGANRDSHTAVYVGGEVPGPKNSDGTSAAIQIGQVSPDGYKVDRFHMPPGRAAVVRSATSKESFNTGSIQLVTDRGLRYGVPDLATAQALGLTPQDPAPESIIKLLPVGASLNTRDVMRTFDSLPIEPGAGTFASQEQQAGGN